MPLLSLAAPQGYDLLAAVNARGRLEHVDLSGTGVYIDMLAEALAPSFAAPHCSNGAGGSSSGVSTLCLSRIGCACCSAGHRLTTARLLTCVSQFTHTNRQRFTSTPLVFKKHSCCEVTKATQSNAARCVGATEQLLCICRRCGLRVFGCAV